MKVVRHLFILLLCFAFSTLYAQQVVNTSGGKLIGEEGEVSYSIGGVVYSSYSGTGATIIEGIQLPYEVVVSTSIGSVESIDLKVDVAPNPTAGKLILTVKNGNILPLNFVLSDSQGSVIEKGVVSSENYYLSLETVQNGVYFLSVSNKEATLVKSFKILKKK